MIPIFLTLGLAVSTVVALYIPGGHLYLACTKPKTVALTFDDGPYTWLPDIVDQLDAADAKGTFFFNGQNWNCIYNQSSMERVRYAYERGHLIGSHTWAHHDLTSLTYDQIDKEMFRTEEAIQRITGALVGFMRPPYGSWNEMVLNVSRRRGQHVIKWDFDPGDNIGKTPNESKSLYDEKIAQHPSTILTVHHETRNTTVSEVLPYAISMLKGSGYQLVTVAECLDLIPYQSLGSPAVPANWTCGD